MQLHCLAEPKLERESVINIPSSCLSFDGVFLFINNSGGEQNGSWQ